MVDKLVPNGTLPNIKEYARIAFGDDVDQQKAFTQLVAAFVVKLHKKASFNKTFYKKRYTNGKLRRYDFNKPVKAWIRSGTVDCFATIVDIDTNVLSKLKNVQEQNNGIDFTHLKYLDFGTDYRVQIRWDGLNYKELVPLMNVKLIGAPVTVQTTRNHYIQ